MGKRSFASDNQGTIYQLATGAAIANTLAGPWCCRKQFQAW